MLFASMIITLVVAGLCCIPTASAQVYGPNLVANGDFADGNTGFDTDYDYVDPANTGTTLQPEGLYTIAGDASDYHNNFVGTPYTGDYFMIVNGATDNEICPDNPGDCDDYWVVWEQNIPVDPNETYEFSFQLSSLVTTSPANLEITIFINGDVFDEVFLAPDETEQWVQKTWTNMDKVAGATISIVETSKVKTGNDFGLDDIMFRTIGPEPAPCPPFDDVITVNVTDVTCPGADDGMIEVIMEGAKPFNICLHYGCEPEDELEYELLDKAQTAKYSGLLPGEYLISVVDANGCEYEICVEVGEPEPIDFQLVYDEIECNGETTDVTVIGMGGNPPYTLFDGETEVASFDESFTVNDLGAAEYSWTLGDAHGCEPAVIEFELEEPPLLEATYEAGDILCYGDETSVTVYAEGGTPPYQLFDGDEFAADFENGEVTLTVLAGDYNWTVVDDNGCEADVNIEIEQPEELEADASVTEEILCYGEMGEITVVVSGGTPPYNVELDNGEESFASLKDGESFVFNLPAGSYSFTIYDDNECTTSAEVTLGQPEELMADYQATEIECHGGFSTVIVTAWGGTPPYELFDGDDFAGDLVDGQITLEVPADSYSWTVVDANGCDADVSFTLTEPDPIVATLVSTEDASCFGAEDGMAIIDVEGGTPPYSFSMGSWVDGQLVIDGLGFGSYTVEITDSKNCGPEEVEFDIDQPEELVIDNIDVEIPLCAPDNFPGCEEPWAVGVIEYNVGFSTYGDGTVDDDRQELHNVTGMPDYSNSPPITFVSLGFGGDIILEMGCEILNGEGYDFTVVETSYGQTDCENYPEKADVYVAQDAAGPWSYLGETCLTGSFDLEDGVDEFGDPFVLEWALYVKVVDVSDSDDFGNGDGFDVNGIDIHHAAGTGQTSSSTTISFSGVEEGMLPEFTIYDEDDEVVSISNVAELEGLEPGIYTVVLEVDGCFSEPVEFTVPEFPDPIMVDVDVTDPLCYGDENGEAHLVITGGTPPFTLEWNGEVVTDVEDEYTITSLREGSYVVTIIDAHECVEVITIQVNEPEELTVVQDNGEIACHDGETYISLEVSGGTPPYTLSDNDSDFSTEIGASEILEGFPAGDYSWTVTDANGCSFLVEFSISQPEPLVANESYEPILCYGGMTDVVVTASGGTGPYELYDGDALVAEFDPDYTLENLGAEEYNWMVVDANGCDVPVEFEIEQPEELTVEIVLDPEQLLCHNGLTQVDVIPDGGTYPYTLTMEEETVEFDVDYRVEDLEPGTYSWTLTDANECGPVSIDFTIDNPDPIDYEYTKVDVLGCFGDETGEIHVTAWGGTGELSYSLDGGEPQMDGSFTGLMGGDYEVTVTDENGCFVVFDVFIDQPEPLVLEITDIIEADFDENNGEIWAYITGGVGPYNVCLFTECLLDDEGEEHTNKSQGVHYWDLEPGWYMIHVVDQNGCEVSECVEVPELDEEVDEDNILSDNLAERPEAVLNAYPNPFRTNATIEFELLNAQNVTLEIYNMVGERVEVLFQGHVEAMEKQTHNFNAETLPNGVYFYRLTLGNKVYYDKIILSR